jgi:response regulator RpfG family c-di-GMP phosphodiesterase
MCAQARAASGVRGCRHLQFTLVGDLADQIGVPDEQTRIEVLVVDDDPALCGMLRASLDVEGIEVVEAHHVIEAERRLAESVPDAIVLDIGLPGVDGVFYCERLRETPPTRRIPIVAISGSDEAGARAVAAGANAFVRKPFDPLLLVGTIERLVGVLPFEHALGEEHRGGGGADIRRLIEIGQRQHELLADAYRQTLGALADALESRDFGTGAHSRRVAAYATRLTLEVEPSLVDDPTLEWGFLLHDVGKIAIPDDILFKPGHLTESERAVMEQHTVLGEKLVDRVPLLQGEGIRVVRSHHERWDGAGYPDGKAGRTIPLAARIFSVADTLDAVTEARPYRAPVRWDAAIGLITDARGTQFDPDAVDALAACETDLQGIRSQIRARAA